MDASVEVMGHAYRAEPLPDDCLGLMMPLARKSVGPLAAVTAPNGSRPSISRYCISSASRRGQLRRRSLECATGCCRGRSSAVARSRRGSWTTPAFPRRVNTRSVWRGNSAGQLGMFSDMAKTAFPDWSAGPRDRAASRASIPAITRYTCERPLGPKSANRLPWPLGSNGGNAPLVFHSPCRMPQRLV
jgi:hypothetical protein